MSAKPLMGTWLLILSLVLTATGSDWCPDGCCTDDGQAGFCKVEKACPDEHQECDQSPTSEDDCCQELQNSDDQIARIFNPDDTQVHYYTEHTVSMQVSLSFAPECSIEFLTPWPIGPPWIDLKHHTELLI